MDQKNRNRQGESERLNQTHSQAIMTLGTGAAEIIFGNTDTLVTVF